MVEVELPKAFPNLLLLVGGALMLLGLWGKMEYNDEVAMKIGCVVGALLILSAVCLWIWIKEEYLKLARYSV